MRARFASLVGSAVLLVGSACGDDSPVGGSGGASQGGGGAGSGGDAGQPSGGDGGIGGAGGSNGGAEMGGAEMGGAGGGGGSPGAIAANVIAVVLGANCQPFIPPDPLTGGYQVGYENTSPSDASLDIVESTLRLDDGAEVLLWTFDVLPSSSGIIAGNGSGFGDHNHVDGSGSGTGSALGLCAFCGDAASLTVDFSDGSQIEYEMGAFPCVQ